MSTGRPLSATHNARVGLIFFGAYLVLYVGFMVLTAFAPSVMGRPVAGVNLAVLYGLGLIVAAFVLAVLYMFSCKAEEFPAGEDRR